MPSHASGDAATPHALSARSRTWLRGTLCSPAYACNCKAQLHVRIPQARLQPRQLSCLPPRRRSTGTRSSPGTPARRCPQATAPPRAPAMETRQPRQSTTWPGPLTWSTAPTSWCTSSRSGEFCDSALTDSKGPACLSCELQGLGQSAVRQLCRSWDLLLSCWWEHGGMHKGMGSPPAAAACAALLMGMTRSCERL